MMYSVFSCSAERGKIKSILEENFMKTITAFFPHYEFEVRCPYCNLASFIDTEDIADTGNKVCPYCNKTAIITDYLKEKATKSLPSRFMFNEHKLYEKLYDVFSYSVWCVRPDRDCPDRIMITQDGNVCSFNESQVSAEIQIIEDQLQADELVDWADVCIGLIEKFKK